jgi:catechol 2,3-dioxygenase-like lactoylglutathione lyase family enzyme
MLDFIVLYSGDIEKTAKFYRELGAEPVLEKHGNGPVHYSMKMNHVLIEIYPASEGSITRYTMGLKVSKATFQNHGGILFDPDGNRVILCEIDS